MKSKEEMPEHSCVLENISTGSNSFKSNLKRFDSRDSSSVTSTNKKTDLEMIENDNESNLKCVTLHRNSDEKITEEIIGHNSGSISFSPCSIESHPNSFVLQESKYNSNMCEKIDVEMIDNQTESNSKNIFTSLPTETDSTDFTCNNESESICDVEMLENNCESERNAPNESSSKVVVQMLPKVELGNISALLEFNGLRKKFLQNKAFNPVINSTALLTQPRQNLFVKESDFDCSYDDSDLDDYGKDSVENDDLSNISSIFSDDDNLLSDSPKAGSSKSQSSESSKKDTQKACHRDLDSLSTTNLNDIIQQSSIGNFLIYPGCGIKFGDIPHIVSGITSVSGQVIRILHYLLYNVYGLTGSEDALKQSKQNILQFSGFPFDEDSHNFQKKRSCLSNLPYPLLSSIYNLLIEEGPISRPDIVHSLLTFLKKPSIEMNSHQNLKGKTLSDIEELKRKALQGQPVVKLQKLAGNFIEKMIHIEAPKSPSKHLNLPVKKTQLKDFPDIVTNIQTARRRIINLLHSLIFGRPGSDEKNRNNILEFSGFKSHGKSYYTRGVSQLYKLKRKELWQLCETFTIRAKSDNKKAKIKKLMTFLHDPTKYFDKKKRLQNVDFASVNVQRVSKKLLECDVLHQKSIHPKESDSTQDKEDIAKSKKVIKLSDFEIISSNIECSTPDELSELNDLLFIKPCDSSEIHQKILDSTSFTFCINSMDYHFRRTLLHYMDIKSIKKIARILDIEDWETQNSKQDLASKILKFLTDMKLPDAEDKKKRAILELKKKQRPHILKVNSFGTENFNQRMYRSPEPLDSTYGSEEVYEQDRHERSSTPNFSLESAQHLRSRCRKNGLSVKQEQILNDTTPLLDFMHHPTEKELQLLIDKIVNSSLYITMGDLVKEVLNCYPNFNLLYRIDFIKSTALEILQDLRLSAINFDD